MCVHLLYLSYVEFNNITIHDLYCDTLPVLSQLKIKNVSQWLCRKRLKHSLKMVHSIVNENIDDKMIKTG